MLKGSSVEEQLQRAAARIAQRSSSSSPPGEHRAAVVIQRCARARMCLQRFSKQRASAVEIQTTMRGHREQRRYVAVRAGASLIQRKQLARSTHANFSALRRGFVALQARARGLIARRAVHEMRQRPETDDEMVGAVGCIASTLEQASGALRREIRVMQVRPGQRNSELLWQLQTLLQKVHPRPPPQRLEPAQTGHPSSPRRAVS